MRYIIKNFAWEISMIKIKLDLIADWFNDDRSGFLNSDIGITQSFFADKRKLSFIKRIRVTRLIKKANNIHQMPAAQERDEKLRQIVSKIFELLMRNDDRVEHGRQ
jgi:hypothetical protein